MERFDANWIVLAVSVERLPTAVFEWVERILVAAGGRPARTRFGASVFCFADQSPAGFRQAVRASHRVVSGLETRYGIPIRIAIASGVVNVHEEPPKLAIEGAPVEVAAAIVGATRSERRGVFVADPPVESFADYRPLAENFKGREEAIRIYEAIAPAGPPPIPAGMQRLLERGTENFRASPPAQDASGALNSRYGSMLEAMRAEQPEAAPEDSVVCTVFAPAAASPAQTILVQVFAHLLEAAGEAAELAAEFDSAAARRAFRSLAVPIKRGAVLGFALRIPGCEVDDPIATLTWQGAPEGVQFGVSIPETLRAGTVVGTVTVTQDSVPVGHLKFKLEIRPGAATAEDAPTGESARRYNTAFISYASSDREKVLTRIQMLAALGIRYFQDVLDLEPGVRWERELYRHIDACDLFLLFWSRAASESPWVQREVRYALSRRGDDELGSPEIMPVILEGPPIVPPPPELAHLHFNDRLLYFMSSAGSGTR